MNEATVPMLNDEAKANLKKIAGNPSLTAQLVYLLKARAAEIDIEAAEALRIEMDSEGNFIKFSLKSEKSKENPKKA